MAANRTRAQIAQGYKDRGIMAPTPVKLEGEALDRHLRQQSRRYDSAKGKAARSRAATKRQAIAMAY